LAKPIPLLGWILIVFTIILIISLFISLFSRLKEKGQRSNWANTVKRAGDTLRDPFAEENKKIHELSKRVQRLKAKTYPNEHSQNGNHEAGVKNEHQSHR
jgi:FtsZ-interacting cell division protein ZipA